MGDGHGGIDKVAPDLHLEHDKQENQARQHGPGYALPPDPFVSTTGICFVGVRLGQAPDATRALRHDARGRLEGAVQEHRDASLPHRGPRTQRKAPHQSGKFLYFIGYLFAPV